jgi:hypothetical protein
MTKFSMKQIACAITMAGACMTAQAAQYDLGDIPAGLVPTPFSGAVSGAGVFQDVFTFTLPANLGSGYSVINFPVSFPGIDFNTILNQMALVSNPDGLLFNGDDDTVATSIAPGGNSLTLSWGPGDANHIAAGGNMYLVVSGIATGTDGGLYSGGISVTPIPEPEVWAMMLVGVGLVGFRLRHRSKRVSAARFA